MANVTENEKKVLAVIEEGMRPYADEGFSDVMVEDITDGTGLNVKSAKGVLGSLIKKNLVTADDVNGEYNVYYITQAGRDAM